MGRIKDHLIDQEAHVDIDAGYFAESEAPHVDPQRTTPGINYVGTPGKGGVLIRVKVARSWRAIWILRPGEQVQTAKTAPDFGRLSLLTDWVPFKATRKQQKKLLADESAEIGELLAANRVAVARWRTLLAYLAWARYLLSSPLGAAIRALTKTYTGG